MRRIATENEGVRSISTGFNTFIMKNKTLPLALIFFSLILILLNFILQGNELDTGFWMRISSSVLLILAMLVTLHGQKKQK